MNYSVMTRLLTAQEAAAIRAEHFKKGSSLSILGQRLHVRRKTLLDIIHQRNAYSKANDKEHIERMNDGYEFSPELKKRRAEIVPYIIWED